MSNAIALLWSGFGQPENMSNGERDLERKLLKVLPRDRVFRHRWNDKRNTPLKVACIVRKRWDADKELRVVLTGHSKGGNTANDCAWCLRGFFVPVHALILCDAFGDHLGRDTIVVPGNVNHCEVFRSTENWIEGSAVQLQDPGWTQMTEHPPQSTPHPRMDEDEDYHNAVLRACTNGPI